MVGAGGGGGAVGVELDGPAPSVDPDKVVEGAQKHRTGLQIDISGTEGVLRITNPLAFQNKNDNAIEGMEGDATTFSPLPLCA